MPPVLFVSCCLSFNLRVVFIFRPYLSHYTTGFVVWLDVFALRGKVSWDALYIFLILHYRHDDIDHTMVKIQRLTVVTCRRSGDSGPDFWALFSLPHPAARRRQLTRLLLRVLWARQSNQSVFCVSMVQRRDLLPATVGDILPTTHRGKSDSYLMVTRVSPLLHGTTIWAHLLYVTKPIHMEILVYLCIWTIDDFFFLLQFDSRG